MSITCFLFKNFFGARLLNKHLASVALHSCTETKVAASQT